MVKVKVCGISDIRTADALNAALPDFVGFVLSGGFRRSVQADAALKIRRALDGRIVTVGVFVNESREYIASFVRNGTIGAVQLHGDEDGEYISALRTMCAVPVIKAVTVRNGVLPPVPVNADYLLLDAFSEGKRGGTGRRVEWKRYSADMPVMLAGGITPENVREAIERVRPFAVDCSGGVETDGHKDAKKIIEYVKNVREIEL